MFFVDKGLRRFRGCDVRLASGFSQPLTGSLGRKTSLVESFPVFFHFFIGQLVKLFCELLETLAFLSELSMFLTKPIGRSCCSGMMSLDQMERVADHERASLGVFPSRGPIVDVVRHSLRFRICKFAFGLAFNPEHDRNDVIHVKIAMPVRQTAVTLVESTGKHCQGLEIIGEEPYHECVLAVSATAFACLKPADRVYRG